MDMGELKYGVVISAVGKKPVKAVAEANHARTR